MSENKALRNFICLAVTLVICGSFLGAAETAAADSRDNRDNSNWYVDLSHTPWEFLLVLPLTSYYAQCRLYRTERRH